MLSVGNELPDTRWLWQVLLIPLRGIMHHPGQKTGSTSSLISPTLPTSDLLQSLS